MLLNDLIKIDEPSILKAKDIVQWKRSKGSYNFSSLPKVALIALKKNAFSRKTLLLSKKIKGISGKNYSYKSKLLLCSDFGSGSTSIILLLEELHSLGVKKFIFVGLAGIMDNHISEGEANVISSVRSLVGSSYYYSKKENINAHDLDWLNKTATVLGINMKTSICVDAPFRETPALIRFCAKNNISLIEMETAGLYAFSEFYGVSCLSILIGADRLSVDTWEHPKNIEQLIKKQKDIIQKLIKHLI